MLRAGYNTTGRIEKTITSFDRIIDVVCNLVVGDLPEAMADKWHQEAIVQCKCGAFCGHH